VNADNREVFPALPDESVDLILTDPPYKDYQSHRPVAHPKVKRIAEAGFDIPFFIEQSRRVLKPGSHFYCFCDHLSFAGIFRQIEALKEQFPPEKRLNYKNCLVWVKSNHGSGDLKGNFAPQHEFIIFAVKGKGKRLNGKRLSNVLYKRTDKGIEFYSKVSNYDFNHGTVKPVEILKMLLEASSAENDLVLDPYAGVMSTAEACILTGRRYLMSEIDMEHYSEGVKRLKGVETTR
jgi:site-specific DNA-methyltransferase (adenine-specific)